MNSFEKRFLEAMRLGRIRERLSQAAIAEKLGMKQQQYQALESIGSGLTLSRLNQIAQLLNIDVEKLKTELPAGAGETVSAIEHFRVLRELTNAQTAHMALQDKLIELAARLERSQLNCLRLREALARIATEDLTDNDRYYIAKAALDE